MHSIIPFADSTYMYIYIDRYIHIQIHIYMYIKYSVAKYIPICIYSVAKHIYSLNVYVIKIFRLFIIFAEHYLFQSIVLFRLLFFHLIIPFAYCSIAKQLSVKIIPSRYIPYIEYNYSY